MSLKHIARYKEIQNESSVVEELKYLKEKSKMYKYIFLNFEKCKNKNIKNGGQNK